MFNVDLSIRNDGGPAVVALRGDLDLAATPGVASHLIVAIAACGPWVIVDLAGLESIGYTALAVLVRVLRWTRGSGGDLSLVAPQQQVLRVLKATGLISVFSVYPSVEQAASSAALAQPWSPAAGQRSCAAMAARPGGCRLPARATCGRPARALPGRGTCQPRRMLRGACRKQHPGTGAS